MLNLLVAFLLCFRDQEPQFPANQGAINDFANILSDEHKTKLRNECAALRDSGGAAVVVVTTPSLYGLDVADYSNQLFKKWGIGNKKEDNGVLLLIAPNERKARIETGYGNESRLTDLESKAIISDVIRPIFREAIALSEKGEKALAAQKFSESVVAGTEAILRKLGGGAPTPILNQEPVPSSSGAEWLILGMSPWLVIPIGIILFILLIYFMAKTGIGLGDFSGGGGGWSSGGGGGGGWSSGGGSSSSGGSSESSSCGGGSSGGGGASGDL